MNVVDNLNSVKVINKPSVCTRTMRLSTFSTLPRDREQIHYRQLEEQTNLLRKIQSISVRGRGRPNEYRVHTDQPLAQADVLHCCKIAENSAKKLKYGGRKNYLRREIEAVL